MLNIVPPVHPQIGDSIEVHEDGQWLPTTITNVTRNRVIGYIESQGITFSYSIQSYRQHWRYR